MIPLRSPLAPSREEQTQWLSTQLALLRAEAKLDREQTSLLRSKAPLSLLATNGLALLELGASGTRAGPGGKRLVELEKSAAFHAETKLPPHTFRTGDVVRMYDAAAQSGAGGKAKKKEATAASVATEEGVGGVVYRVDEKSVTLSLKSDKKEQGDALPARIHLVKEADEAVHRRLELNMLKLAKILGLEVDETSSGKKKGDESSSSDDDDETSSSTPSTSLAPSPLVLSLLGLATPKWANSSTSELQLFDPSLNDSQKAALRHALAAQHFALIHGPPGTGKTSTVAEIVLQLALAPGQDVSQRKRVLVCAASNLAADNVLARVFQKGAKALREADIGATRVGHPARVLLDLSTATLDYQSLHSSEGSLLSDVRSELSAALNSLSPSAATAAGNKSSSRQGTASAKPLRGSARKEAYEQVRALRKEARKRERGLSKSVLQRAGIVVSTCHGAGSRALSGQYFDSIVVDEACQALEAAVWIPLLQRSKPETRLILAGDHLQLPPTVKGYRHSSDPRRLAAAAKQGKRAAQKQEKKAHEVEADEASSEEETAAQDEASDDEAEVAFATSKLALGESKGEAATQQPRPKLRHPRSLETTLFSRLLGMYGPACKALLEEQYRMNTEIMTFPSEALYESRLKANESCAQRTLADVESFETRDEDPKEELWGAPLVFYDTAGADMFEQEGSGQDSSGKSTLLSESKSNANEAEIVLKHVELLLSRGLPQTHITVLAPYASQVSLLAKTLHKYADVEVGTVDSQQGRENSVVIISLVRSNEKGVVGFLSEKRRLNVAMTRAKMQLCIVGDSSTVEKGGEYLANWVEYLSEKALVEVVTA